MVRTTTVLVALLLLAGGAFGAAASSGALAESGQADDATADGAVPDRPSPLTAANVDEYAIAYERAVVYAAITEGEGTVTSLDLFCDADVSGGPTAEGFVVRLGCVYSYEGELDGGPYIADGAPYTVTYHIDGTSTERGEVQSEFGSPADG